MAQGEKGTMKIEIKSRFDSSILFSMETENWKLAVEAAVRSGAYLGGANLGRANLEGANLGGANLGGANLEGAEGFDKFPIQIGGHKHWLCTTSDGRLQIGCHVYTLEEWQEHADAIGRKQKYSALDIEIYKLHIGHIEKISKLLWNAKVGKK